MFARVTPYKMKESAREAALQQMKDLKSEIMAMPGMRSFVNVMDETGRGYIVALVDSREVSEKNAGTVRMLWAKFSDHLEETPEPEGYDVMAEWSN